MNPIPVRTILGYFVSGQWQSLYAVDSCYDKSISRSRSFPDGLAESLLCFSPRYLFGSITTIISPDRFSPSVRLLILSVRSSFFQAFHSFTHNDTANFSRFISAAAVGILKIIRDLGYVDSFDQIWLDSDLVYLEHTFQSFFTLHDRLSCSLFPRRLTVVLGMHRSGTSALTGMLNSAGLDAPTDPLGATESNPLGYWESERLVGTTDQFLARSGFHWSTLFSFSPSWYFTPEARHWSLSYFESMSIVFPQSKHALLKDPRLCILSHGFSSWLQSGLADVDFVLIIRQPLEVAFSLQKSEGLSLYQAICLWLSSVLESERLSRTMPRVCVTYDHLLDHPASVMESCIELFDGNTPFVDQQVLELSATSFVRPDFRRQRSESLTQLVSNDAPLCDLLSFADSVYRIFETCSLKDLHEYSGCLDRLYDQWRLFATTLAIVDNKLISER